MTGSKLQPGITMLVIAVFFVSWAAILIRLCESDPTTIAFFRMFFATIMVLAAIPFYRRTWFTERRDLLFCVISGIFLGLHFLFWISSLQLTSISSSVVLVTTQPVFVAVLGLLFLKEKIGIFGAVGIVLAIVGSYLVARGDLKLDTAHLKGDLLSLLGALAAGLYLFFGRFVRRRVDLLPYVTTVYGISALTIMLVGLATGSLKPPTSQADYVFFFLLALGPTILGHNLYNYSLKHLPVFPVGMSILGEPVLATVWGFIIFDEKPIATTLFGGIIIITAIALVMIRLKSKPEITA